MKAGTHWVLNAAAVDRSLMRHKLSYDLFLSLATTNAPRYAASSRFVEVDLNGRYQGVYLLMQRVDGALLNFRPFDRNDPSHGCLYKAIDHAADFSQPNGAGFDQREPDPGVCQDPGNRWRTSTGSSARPRPRTSSTRKRASARA